MKLALPLCCIVGLFLLAATGSIVAAEGTRNREVSSRIEPSRRGAPSGKDFSRVRYADFVSLLPTHGNTIAAVLRKRGLTRKRVARLQYVTESSCASETAADELDWIWEYILEPAEPYKFWLPSRNALVEIYLPGETEPAGFLSVNETDATTTEGSELSYMCHGLYPSILEKTRKSRAGASTVSSEAGRLLECPADRIGFEDDVESDKHKTHQRWRVKVSGCGKSGAMLCEPTCSPTFSCQLEL